MKVDYNKTLEFGIDYGNRYCEGKLTFEGIANFPTMRKLLIAVYSAMTAAKDLVPIEKITDEEKLQLKNISAKYASKLTVAEKIDFCKAVWALAEIVDRFCVKKYFPKGLSDFP